MQTKDMKFSRSEWAWTLHLYHHQENVEKFRYAALKTLKDFFLPDNLQKGRQKNVQDYYPLQHHFFEQRKNH